LTPACQGIKLTGVANLFARIVKRLTPKRRWVQFSLVTMFLFVTVLCMGLALVVGPADRQRQAVAAIKALGGSVVYANPNPGVSDAFPRSFLRRWLPRDFFDEVREINVQSSKVTDAGLKRLKGLTRLDALRLLDATNITNAGLAHLRGLTRLKALWLRNSQVTDAGLTHLRGLTGLRQLRLDGTQVTNGGLAQLQRLTSLSELYLGRTQVPDAGLVHLQGLTELRWIDLRRTQVTDAGLAYLQGLTGLHQLDLSNTQVTDAGLAKLRQALPNCQIMPGRRHVGYPTSGREQPRDGWALAP
jgi:hypothetical protein